MAESGRSATAVEERFPVTPAERHRLLIVERARSGDREAFEALVESNLGATFRTALAILGSEADARDATQEVFLKAWRELPRLREADRFGAWLGRIVVNTCRTARRTRERRRIREIDVEQAAAQTLRSRGPALDERIGDLEVLQKAFERLPIPARTILALHYLEHRSLAEISAVLGVPEGTVKSRLHAARQSFERALEVTNR
jgi:RNA polymerase sigma-70 factor, ECF subfamily